MACGGRTAPDFAQSCVDQGGGDYVAADPSGPMLFLSASDGAELASQLETVFAAAGCGGTTIRTPAGTTATVPDYSHTVPTENSLRDDLGRPRRNTYYPPRWPGGPPW